MKLTSFFLPSVCPGYFLRNLSFFIGWSAISICSKVQGLFVPVLALPLVSHWPRYPCGSSRPSLSFRCHLDLPTGPWVCRYWTGMEWGGGIAKGLDNIGKFLGFSKAFPHLKWFYSHFLYKEKQKENKEILFLIKKIWLFVQPGGPLFFLSFCYSRGRGASIPSLGAWGGLEADLWPLCGFFQRLPEPQTQHLPAECKLSWSLS